MDAVIRRGTYANADAWILENETLRCVCLPEHGGKLASLYHKGKKFELLFQSPSGAYREAAPGSAFGDFEACGFDDAFPSIDAETVSTGRGPVRYFDHGEIWTAKFACEPRRGGLRLVYQSPYLGFRYEKTLSLSGCALSLAYAIRNERGAAFPCLWACHCLVVCRDDMRLLFPEGTLRVMTVMATEKTGPAGTVCRFPLHRAANGGTLDFTCVPPAEGLTMLKYFCVDAAREGRCGYRYPSEGIEALMRYDPEKLPYLGFWVTAGGYRGDVNCALEPTNGFYDSISAARANGKCPKLEPGAEMAFELEITLKACGEDSEVTV